MPDSNVSDELKRAILYYPRIKIPINSWLRQSLLYWDEIATIVPGNLYDFSFLRDSAISFLMEEGVYRPIYPSKLLRSGQDNLREFQEEFYNCLQLANKQGLMLPIEQRIEKFEDIRKAIQRSEYYKRTFTRLHRSKAMPISLYNFWGIRTDRTSESILGFLEDNLLAKREPNNEWIYFEPTTARIYISLLAKYLADDDSALTIPSTDDPKYENLLFQTQPDPNNLLCVSTALKSILPVPRSDVRLSSILKFKRRRHFELLSLRQLLEDFQRELKVCKNDSEIKQVCVNYREKISKGVKYLVDLLKDSHLAAIGGTLKTIIKLDSPVLWTTAGIIVGNATKVADIPLEWSLSGIGIMGAIEVSTYLIDKRNERRTKLRDSLFSYLALANEEGITRQNKITV